MVAGFEVRDLKPPGFLDRLLRRQPRENAFVELNNLLARAKNVRDVSSEDVLAIAERYRLDLASQHQPELSDLYRRYLTHCLADRSLSESDVRDLEHLKRLFGLNDALLQQVHDDVAATVYGETTDEAMSDGRLSEDERRFLEKLQTELKIPESLARSIFATAATERLQRYLQLVTADERLAPEEEAELAAIARSLGVTVKHDQRTAALLEKYRLLWQVENGDLPTIPVTLYLQRGETCHFTTEADWQEQRTVTRKIRYSGPTVRVRIVRGVYWRLGEASVQPVREDVMTYIDTGVLFLTNKRLIFRGGRRNTTIRLKDILDFAVFRNGVEIIKDRGRNPMFVFDQDSDIFGAILERVLSDAA